MDGQLLCELTLHYCSSFELQYSLSDITLSAMSMQGNS